MKTERAPFLPVSSDIDDDRLERLAHDKGVGALVTPAVNRQRAGEGASVAAPAVAKAQEVDAFPSGATPRSRMKTVNLELPDYVWTDLKIRAAHQQTSVRHIVMAALKEKGVPISDADMIEDGRRLRT